MKDHKKTAALLAGLLLCLGNTAAPVMSGYAADTEVTTAASEAASDEEEGEEDAGFRYTVDSDGNATVIGCTLGDKEITIPDTLGGKPVTEIATRAFLRSSIQKINIPASVEYISTDDPFSSCVALTEINVSPDNENYTSQDGVLYSKDMKVLAHYPASKEGTSYDIPDGVEEIGIAAFAESSLKSITVPDSVKTIGRHSFSFCTLLEAIDMSGTKIETVDVMAFAGCESLTSVKFSDFTKEIALAAFMDCKKLEEVELPPELVYVGQNAFAGTAMMKVRIPESVTDIGYSAFGYDSNNSVVEGFTIIGTPGSAAQTYCTDSDTEYDYKNNFEFKSEQAAADEEEYNNLETKAFEDYEYTMIDGKLYITFCVSMDDVIKVPAEMDGIPVYGLYKNAFITNEAAEIILPDGLKEIGLNMFSPNLKKLTIPGSCENIDGDEPFVDCAALEEITVTDGDGAFSSQDGVLYDHDKKTVYAYPRAKQDKTYKAPSSVEEIWVSAFCGNSYIEEVELTNVKVVGNYAFETCSKLSSVKFSDKLEQVGMCSFFDCPSLKSVRLGNNLSVLGDYSFAYYYDQELEGQIANGTSDAEDPYTTYEDFTIYADEGSTGYKYAKACGINVVTNTYGIGGVNVHKGFLITVISIIGAAILALIGMFIGKSVKKKKASKPAAKKTDSKPETDDDASGKEEKEEAEDEADEDN